MSESTKKTDEALSGVSEERRTFLKKVAATTAFAAPVVASFAIQGMMVTSAAASNCSNC